MGGDRWSSAKKAFFAKNYMKCPDLHRKVMEWDEVRINFKKKVLLLGTELNFCICTNVMFYQTSYPILENSLYPPTTMGLGIGKHDFLCISGHFIQFLATIFFKTGLPTPTEREIGKHDLSVQI